jgi:hypothetical protein
MDGGTLMCGATRVGDAPRCASEGAILFLTLGCALAYATPHSPWTTVERACKPDATCSHAKGAYGAVLDASGGGWAVMVFVAL